MNENVKIEVEKMRKSLVFEGFNNDEVSDKSILYKLYAEKKYQLGQFKLYRRFCDKASLGSWIDTHEPYEEDDEKKDWLNGWSSSAGRLSNDELIVAIKKEERSK